MLTRPITTHLFNLFSQWNKMIFLSGPRQVGKTTLAKSLQKFYPQSLYVNWDNLKDQKKIVQTPYFFEDHKTTDQSFLLCFDELHKYRRWKNYLKGIYDTYQNDLHLLVTGSGKLDIYQKGGDSLLGRSLNIPLFPLSLAELQNGQINFAHFEEQLFSLPPCKAQSTELYEQLFQLGGFPDPFTKGEEAYYDLWKENRNIRLVREDIRDATRIRELSLMESLIHLIEPRIGAPLSINNLKQDLQVSFETVRDWLKVLENFYYLFMIPPYTYKNSRSLLKEKKLYLYDWASVDDLPYRFENMIALHLLKACQTWKQLGQAQTELFYIRDKEKREVDFLITLKKKPFLLVEAKWKERSLSPALLYYQQKYELPLAIQVIHESGIAKKTKNGKYTQWLVSADRFLSLLV